MHFQAVVEIGQQFHLYKVIKPYSAICFINLYVKRNLIVHKYHIYSLLS
jgi:hypothetical protein